jgi:hypothetical protein
VLPVLHEVDAQHALAGAGTTGAFFLAACSASLKLICYMTCAFLLSITQQGEFAGLVQRLLRWPAWGESGAAGYLRASGQ